MADYTDAKALLAQARQNLDNALPQDKRSKLLSITENKQKRLQAQSVATQQNVDRLTQVSASLNPDALFHSEDGVLPTVANSVVGAVDTGLKLAGATLTSGFDIASDISLVRAGVKEEDFQAYSDQQELYAQQKAIQSKVKSAKDPLQKRGYLHQAGLIKQEIDSLEDVLNFREEGSQNQYADLAPEGTFTSAKLGNKKEAIANYLSNKKYSDVVQDSASVLTDYVDRSSSQAVVDRTKESFDTFGPEFSEGFKQLMEGNVVEGGKAMLLASKDMSVEAIQALGNNPDAIALAVAESLPHIALAGKTIVGSLIGNASSKRLEAIDAYMQENDGAIPVGEDLESLLAYSGAGAVVASGSDKVLGTLGKVLTPARKAPKTPLTKKNVAPRATAQLAKGGATEYPAEFAEGVLEQKAVDADKDVDYGKAHGAGVLGFAGGVGQATGIPTAGIEATKSVLQKLAPTVKAKAEPVVTEADLDAQEADLQALAKKARVNVRKNDSEFNVKQADLHMQKLKDFQNSRKEGVATAEIEAVAERKRAPIVEVNDFKEELEVTTASPDELVKFAESGNSFKKSIQALDTEDTPENRQLVVERAVGLFAQFGALADASVAEGADPTLKDAVQKAYAQENLIQGIAEHLTIDETEQGRILDELTQTGNILSDELITEGDSIADNSPEQIAQLTALSKRVLYSTIQGEGTDPKLVQKVLDLNEVTPHLSDVEVEQLESYLGARTSEQVRSDITDGTHPLFTGANVHASVMTDETANPKTRAQAEKRLLNLKQNQADKLVEFKEVLAQAKDAWSNQNGGEVQSFKTTRLTYVDAKPTEVPYTIHATSEGITAAEKTIGDISEEVTILDEIYNTAKNGTDGKEERLDNATKSLLEDIYYNENVVEETSVTEEQPIAEPAEELPVNTEQDTPVVETPVAEEQSVLPVVETAVQDATELTDGAIGFNEEATYSKMEAKFPDASPEMLDTLVRGERAKLQAVRNQGASRLLSTVWQKGKEVINDRLSDADKEFVSTNLLVKHFKARANTALNSVPNAVNKLISKNTRKIKEVLGSEFNTDTLTQEDFNVLDRIPVLSAEITEYLKENVSELTNKAIATGNYKHTRPTLFFTNEEGDLDQHASDAMAMALLTWFGAGGVDNYNSPETLRLLLGGKAHDTHSLPPGTFDLLALAGKSKDKAYTALGRNALTAMGLTPKDSSIPATLQSTIEKGLGADLVNILKAKGWVEEVRIPTREINELRAIYHDNPDLRTPQEEHLVRSGKEPITSFLRMAQLSDGSDLKTELDTLTTDIKGSSGLLNELINGSKGGYNYVGQVPKDKATGVMQTGTQQQVPSALLKIGNTAQKIPQYLNRTMLSIFDDLGREAILKLRGYESEENRQASVLETIKGKNQTALNEVDTLDTLLARFDSAGLDYDTPLHFEYSYPVTGRQQEGGDVSPQRSKFHRYAMSTKPSTIKKGAKSQSFTWFQLATAQALGLKTDKQSMVSSIDQLNAMLHDPLQQAVTSENLSVEEQQKLSTLLLNKADVRRQAIDNIKEYLQGNESLNKDLVQEAVNRAGEGMHSLKGMVSYAEYELSQGDTFETTLTYEIDGITNGPFNATTQLGLTLENFLQENFSALERGGFYFNAEVSIPYNEWKETSGKDDTYENVATTANGIMQGMLKHLTGMRDKVTKEGKPLPATHRNSWQSTIDALPYISELFGNLTVGKDQDGNTTYTFKRNATKNPVTVTVYSGSKGGINAKFISAIMEDYYVGLDTALQAYDNTDDADVKAKLYAEMLENHKVLSKAVAGTNNFVDTKGNFVNTQHGHDFFKGASNTENVAETVEYLRNFEMDDNSYKGLTFHFERTLGEAINTAIDTEFSENKSSGALITSVANGMHNVFMKEYRATVASKRKELIDAGEISRYSSLRSKDYADIKESLKELMPIFGTFFSTGIADGFLASSESTESIAYIEDELKDFLSDEDEKTYSAEVKAEFKGISDVFGITSKTQSSGVKPDASTFSAPGVRAVPIMNINIDATMQILKYYLDPEGNDTNVFDAIISRLEDLDGSSDAINIASHEAVYKYDMMQEVSDSLERLLTLRPEYTDEPLRTIEGVDIVQSFGDLASEVKAKAELLSDLKSYALSNGSYNQMGGTDKAIVYENGNPTNVSSKLKTQHNNLRKRIGHKSAVTIETIKDKLRKGTYGYSHLVSAGSVFTDLGNTLTGDAINTAIDRIAQNTPNTDTQRIMSRIVKTANFRKGIPADLEVRIVDKILVDGKPDDTKNGMYEPAYFDVNGKRQPPVITLRNTAETLMLKNFTHELLHAVTADTAYRHYVLKERLPADQRNALKAIEKLAKSAWADTANIPATLKNALNHKDAYTAMTEFIAYGLTEHDAMAYLDTKVNKGRVALIVARLRQYIAKMLGIKLANTEFASLVANTIKLANSNAVAHTVENSVPASFSTNTFSAENVFDKLKGTNSNHTEVLRNALRNVESGLTKYLENTYPQNTNAQTGEEQVFLDQLDTETKSNTNRLTALGFKMTPQESLVFQMYATALREGIQDNYFVTRDLRKMFTQAKEGLSYKDFFTAPIAESDPQYAIAKREANLRYTAIFGARSLNQAGVNDKLSDFLAMAQTNEMLRDALAILDAKRLDRKGLLSQTFDEQATTLIDSGFRAMRGAITDTSKLTKVGTKLNKLTKDLVAVKARKQSTLDTASSLFGKVEEASNTAINASLSKITKGIRNIPDTVGVLNATRDLAYTTISVVQKEQAAKAIRELTEKLSLKSSGRLGTGAELVQELLGRVGASQRIDTLARQRKFQVDAKGLAIKDNVPTILRSKFKTELTKEHSVGLTKALLHTDVGYLHNQQGYSLQEISNLMRDGSARKAKMDEVVKNIEAYPAPKEYKNFFVNQAIHLGKFMATGETYTEFQLMNAVAIARLSGTGRKPLDARNTNYIESLIDELASLSAMDSTSEVHLRNASESIEAELAEDATENGITAVLKKQSAVTARDKTRHGEEGVFSTTKGYVHQILDPHKSITYGSRTDSTLERKSFVRTGKLPVDSVDNVNKDTYLYFSEEGGNVSYAQGALATIETTVNGVNSTSGKMGGTNLPVHGSRVAVRKISKAKEAKINILFNKRIENKAPVNSLVPFVGKDGRVSSYRYTLPNTVKDITLDRDNDVANILGAWEARIEEEELSGQFNNALVTELKDQYNKASSTDRKNYFLEVSETSKDEHLRNTWRLLPVETKKAIKANFGENKVYVRKQDLNNTFGYTAPSVLELWGKDKKEYKALTKAFVRTAEAILGKDAAKVLRKGERGLMELVTEVKDIVVIKSIVVPAANIASNLVQGFLRGIPVKSLTNSYATAYTGAKEYTILNREMLALEQEQVLERDPKKVAEYKVRIQDIKDTLARSPVKPLIDAGLLPMIVDDLNEHDNVYSLKNKLMSKMPSTNRVPKSVRRGLGEVFVTQGSTVYRVMNEATALGDFVGKFALYEYLMSQGATQTEALNQAAVEFVDYGSLSSRTLHYLNATGMTSFFKYFLRVQPVILSLIRNNPTRVLMYLTTLGGSVPSVLDSGLLGADFGAKTGTYDLLKGAFSLPVLYAT